MNAHKSIWLALPLALMLPLGCNSGASTTQSSEDVAAAPAAEVAQGAPANAPVGETASPSAHKRHHARGIVQKLFHAAKSLELDATTKATIDGLTAQLRADKATLQAPQQAFHAALVAGVKAGNIDMTKLSPLQANVKSARASYAAREAVALNGLWSALTADQRAAVVAKVREHGGRGEKWAAKREAALEEGGWQAKRTEKLTAELNLDAGQQQQLTTIMAKKESAPVAAEARFAEMKANREAVLTAFASSSFDARTMNLGHTNVEGQSHAAFLAKLVPILRQDQREALATSMQAHS